jgi:hypothetical protein
MHKISLSRVEVTRNYAPLANTTKFVKQLLSLFFSFLAHTLFSFSRTLLLSIDTHSFLILLLSHPISLRSLLRLFLALSLSLARIKNLCNRGQIFAGRIKPWLSFQL